jgi:hypothetical protein
VCAQHIDNLRILAAQLPDRVQDWQVRFTHPVLFQALPAADADAEIGADAVRKGADQRGFADAGLAGHEQQLALASTDLLEQPVHARQRALAPDHPSRYVPPMQWRRASQASSRPLLSDR